MGLIDKLFGRNKKKSDYQADWQSYFSNVDDQLSSIAVDLNLYPIAPIEGQEYVAYISIKMNAPREDGLSDSEEAPQLWKIEDELLASFNKKGLNYSAAGRLTSNGLRDLYYFTDNAQLMEKAVSETMLKFQAYEFNFGHKEDKDWDGYLEFLYPAPRQMQSIQNQKVLVQLEQQGDALEKEREVRHWVYFNTQPEMDQFEHFTNGIGFKTINKGLNEYPGEYKFVILIERTDKIDYHQIDDCTLPLWEKATELNGEYDGWETSAEL